MASQNQGSGGSRVTDLFSMGQQAWQLFASGQVPLALKVIPVLAAAYVLSPLDFLPDVIPLAGQLDDVAILLIGLRVFTQLAARYGASQPSQSSATGAAAPPPAAPYVTATYRVHED